MEHTSINKRDHLDLAFLFEITFCFLITIEYHPEQTVVVEIG